MQLLRALPEHTGMAFVLVQHLDPPHDSSLANLRFICRCRRDRCRSKRKPARERLRGWRRRSVGY
jgi:hypothetical protein